MARLELLGGTYQSQSIIANAQRCINYYPEVNQKDAPTPITHYQRPGLTAVAQGPNAPVRGLYRASNGQGFAAIGSSLMSVSSSFALTTLGDIGNSGNQVVMQDNGNTVLIADGSSGGWTVDMTNVSPSGFAPVNDSTGTFAGAIRLAIMDGFIVGNYPGNSKNWFSTYDNEIVFDGTYIQAKNGYPDPLQGIAVTRREIFLIGQLTSEIWFNAGNAGFPFAELPGTFIQRGTVAPYSIAQNMDGAVYWVTQSLQGKCMVVRSSGYDTKKISSHAIDLMLQAIPNPTDIVGWTYQQHGHIFYMLTSASGDITVVYDDATQMWHQRCWTDGDGNLHRVRDNCGAFMYGTNVVGDWQNGKIYTLDYNNFTDDGQPISFIRGFPHIQIGNDPGGRPMLADGKRIQFHWLALDIECGTSSVMNAPDGSNAPPLVGLRFSLDRGKTFGNTVWQTMGFQGEYLTQPIWRVLGIGRDVVFEIETSAPCKAALNGAWVEADVLES